MHTAIAELEQAQVRSDIPEFRPGDTLKVHVRVTEGTRSRIQIFQGIVIRRQGGGGAGDVHRPQDQLWRRGGAHVPGAHPLDREDRARDPGPGCAGEALLPPRAARQGRPYPGAAGAGALTAPCSGGRAGSRLRGPAPASQSACPRTPGASLARISVPAPARYRNGRRSAGMLPLAWTCRRQSAHVRRTVR